MPPKTAVLEKTDKTLLDDREPRHSQYLDMDSAIRHCTPDADVAADDSPGRILVLRTQEALMIARQTRQVL